MTTQSSEQPAPLLRIVKGDPTPEEVAALVAVVSAMAAGAAEAAARERHRSPSGRRTTASCARRTGTAPARWRASAR